MTSVRSQAGPELERGVAVVSIDTEQIWGYVDVLSASQFDDRYPRAREAHDKMLACLRASKVSATWLVVGGLTLEASAGPKDARMAGLPAFWTTKICSGTEMTAPLWYHQSFVRRLREAQPPQDIGVHGGLTHLIWTGPASTRDVARCELVQGIRALAQIGIAPSSFSFPRDQEAYHELLPEYGIRVYRGRTPLLAYRLGRTLPGALLRALDEVRSATPPLIWPEETLPGLWNIPSSLFLYPLTPSRTQMVPLRTRIERFQRGLDAAARNRGIFHFSLHPENLAESPGGFPFFEDILERLTRARERGDIETMTMSEIGAWMERGGNTTVQALFTPRPFSWRASDPQPAGGC